MPKKEKPIAIPSQDTPQEDNIIKNDKSENTSDFVDLTDSLSISKPKINDDKILCVYPPNEKDAIVVKESDIKCLEENNWLNDIIINFYLRYIEVNSPQKSFLFLNTYFFPALVDNGYEKAYKWTKNIDIFEKKFILVPIIESNSHWRLAIILSNPRYFVENHPTVLLFDSLYSNITSSVNEYKKTFTEYLKHEWKIKKERRRIIGCKYSNAKGNFPKKMIRIVVYLY